MSIINSQPLIGASGQGGYFLTKSLRFRSSASAYLNRTPASASNQTTWTWSGWVKRGVLGSFNSLWSANTAGRASIGFYTDDTFYYDVQPSATRWSWKTTAVFRDPSAWYHVVFVCNTTNATAANRMQVYINGVLQTFGTDITSSGYITQNTSLNWNSTDIHNISRRADGGSYYDGYMTEINFIDGQALTPSSFGETSTSTGVWIPKKYTGTYGTNGFYLPFTDVATTSGSNAGLGKDFSGNGNYWTTNNISVTSGSTYDSMKDVPTLTDTDTANYCVLNPLNQISASVSSANLNLARLSPPGWADITGTISVSSGKWYWESTMISGLGGTENAHVGILKDGFSLPSIGGYNAGSYAYADNGNKITNSSSSAYGASFTNGDVIGVALDLDAGTLVFYKNGVSQGTAFSSLSGSFFPEFSGSSTPVQAANFGQRPFTYTPPTGFKALNTFNLPTPTIGATASSQANKYFDALLYTGNGSASQRTDISWANMQPDMVWIKNRSSANNHVLHDDVRGTNAALQPNLTNATDSPVGFGTDGFGFDGVGNQLRIFTSDGRYNTNGNAYVTWGWKGSGAAGVTNTAGSITSTVSANTTAGFSIVTYTGNGSSGATVGHGLGVAPRMIIIKRRSSPVRDWRVYHASIGNTGALSLNLTDATDTNIGYWNNTSPTSSLFTLGNTGDVNTNALNYVAYCFAEVAGYSRFGSYTGNGSADGTFVYTGFRPRYVTIKNATTGSTNWFTYDSARNTFNLTNAVLLPNNSIAELTSDGGGAFGFDFLSNGFKIRSTRGDNNNNGDTFIYMAFAEVPQKFSLAR